MSLNLTTKLSLSMDVNDVDLRPAGKMPTIFPPCLPPKM